MATRSKQRTPQNDSFLASLKYRLDNSPTARRVGGDAAIRATRPLGVALGGAKTALGLLETAEFVGRLVNPLDPILSYPGTSARAQLAGSLNQAVNYVAGGIRNPQKVANDVKSAAHRANVALNPVASPQAPTFAGEMLRNAKIGLNQGDAAFHVGSTFVPVGTVAKIARFGTLPRAAQEAKYIAQGFTPAEAAHLASPYNGMGHHFYPRSGAPKTFFGHKVPKVIQDFKLPKSVSDGPFNVLRPKGISYGDMYELHFKVDPLFHHTNLPARVGRRLWQGESLGLKKYDSLGRLWHGSPAALHGAVGGILNIGSSVGHVPETDDYATIRIRTDN